MNGRVKRVGDQTRGRFVCSVNVESNGGDRRDSSRFQKTGASPKPESDGCNLTYSGVVLDSAPNGFPDMVASGNAEWTCDHSIRGFVTSSARTIVKLQDGAAAVWKLQQGVLFCEANSNTRPVPAHILCQSGAFAFGGILQTLVIGEVSLFPRNHNPVDSEDKLPTFTSHPRL